MVNFNLNQQTHNQFKFTFATFPLLLVVARDDHHTVRDRRS